MRCPSEQHRKTGRLRKGAVEFSTASSYAHHPNEKPTQRHYQGQVDHFAVYCRQIDSVYLIPIDELPLDRAYLRVTAPLNGQRKRIRYADDYEIARVACASGNRPDDVHGHRDSFGGVTQPPPRRQDRLGVL